MKNDKKKIGFSPTKKVISAAGMLAVSASMLATSTYAWFSMNTSVTATGMQMKAKAEGGIVIAPYTVSSNTFQAPAETAFASTAAAVQSAISDSGGLYPTSTDTSIANWFHATASQVNDYAATAGSYETLTGISTMGVLNNSQYFLVNKFDIKTLTTDAVSLYITDIDVTATNSATYLLDKSLRVAIKFGDTSPTYKFFAPLYASDDTTTLKYVPSVSNGSATPAAYAANTMYKGADYSGVNLSSSLGNTAVPCYIYLYFEGEDTNCTSYNARNIENISVDVTFSTTDTHAAGQGG